LFFFLFVFSYHFRQFILSSTHVPAPARCKHCQLCTVASKRPILSCIRLTHIQFSSIIIINITSLSDQPDQRLLNNATQNRARRAVQILDRLGFSCQHTPNLLKENCPCVLKKIAKVQQSQNWNSGQISIFSLPVHYRTKFIYIIYIYIHAN